MNLSKQEINFWPYFGWINAKLSKLKTKFNSLTYASQISIQKDLKSKSRNIVLHKKDVNLV